MPNDIAARMDVRIKSISKLAEDINSYELIDPAGNELPPFTAGAHIDFYLSGGLVRQYSLCNDPNERDRYVVAVLREEGGAGGSKAVHDTLEVGQLLSISNPRNNFPLADGADRYLFLAGGIGITPIMAMVHACRSDATPFELIYCTRSPERTAFMDELAHAPGVTLHHDDGDPANSFDLTAALSEQMPGTHLYYCGPAGFMAAIETASMHWPADCRHFEYFTAPDAEPTAVDNGQAENEGAFQVKINSSGSVFDVPADKTIVEVLRDNGVEVETSCESGVCGTCRTGYLSGEPEHHDLILDDDERRSDVLICCARATSPLLVLDL